MITQQMVWKGIRGVARDHHIMTYSRLFQWFETNVDLSELELDVTHSRKSYRHAVRPYLTKLVRAGVIRRVGRGRY